MRKKVFQFYMERLLTIAFIGFSVLTLAVIVICIAAENFRIAWIGAIFAFSAITAGILRYVFFND